MIVADDEAVKVSGVLLPGILKSIDITCAALVEEIEVEGKGKKPKQATGYEDAKIILELILLDDIADSRSNAKTMFEKLENIQALFREHSQKKPKVYTIINEHITKRNINRVVFKELSSKETNKKDELAVSLVFWEYEEIKINVTRSSTNSSNYNANVGQDYQGYLNTGRGEAPKIADKTTFSPVFEFLK